MLGGSFIAAACRVFIVCMIMHGRGTCEEAAVQGRGGLLELEAGTTSLLHLHCCNTQGPHKLDWRPDLNRGKDGGTIPKILHHIFLDGEAEYNK